MPTEKQQARDAMIGQFGPQELDCTGRLGGAAGRAWLRVTQKEGTLPEEVEVDVGKLDRSSVWA